MSLEYEETVRASKLVIIGLVLGVLASIIGRALLL